MKAAENKRLTKVKGKNMPISAKKKDQSSNPISFQIEQWFTLKNWTKERPNDEKETDHGFGSTKEICYKQFAALDEEPLSLSMVLLQRKGIDNAFKLNRCYASSPSGKQKDAPVGRRYLILKVSNPIIEEFERYFMKDILSQPDGRERLQAETMVKTTINLAMAEA
jgi:hypothetical protein